MQWKLSTSNMLEPLPINGFHWMRSWLRMSLWFYQVKLCFASEFCVHSNVIAVNRDPHTYQCIVIKNCPRLSEGSRRCPKNEEFSECGFGCDENCGLSNRDFTCRSCFQGCVCRKGCVRSLVTGQCVIKSTCRRKSIFPAFMMSRWLQNFLLVCPTGYFFSTKSQKCETTCKSSPTLN
jgi:hypothetical protein